MSKLKEKIKNFRHYFLNLILIWLAILFYRTNQYYVNLLRPEAQTIIFFLAIAYTSLGIVYYSFVSSDKIRASKGTILFYALKRSIKDLITYIAYFTKNRKPFPKLEKHEKTTLLFILVKIFFLPLMLNFFLNNYFSLRYKLSNLTDLSSLMTINSFNGTIFPFILTLIFLLDTLWFSFGYAFEAKLLKNKVKSVDSTILGWVVALICYPPFNGIYTKYIDWYADNYIIFFNDSLTFIMRIIIILLLLIYLSATFALGTKCSNLTNRGIVARGPYRIIRHPAYISKNLAWWLTIIPVLSWPAILSMSSWSIIYHLRAITEEKHLRKDFTYKLYCKKVRYRYIPYIY